MDKKFTIFGVICILAALLLGYNAFQQQKALAQYEKDHPELFPPAAATGTETGTGVTTAPAASTTPAVATAPTPVPVPATEATTPTPSMSGVNSPAPAAPAAANATYKTVELSNDYIDVTLTEHGGAIQSVTLKKFPAKINSKEPLVFNDGAPEPALSLSVPNPALANQNTYWYWTGSAPQYAAGSPEVPPVELLGTCTLDDSLTTKTSVTFHGNTSDGVEFTRTYSLSSGTEDPYIIHHTTTIANHGDTAVSLLHLFVNAGMAPPPAPGASSYELLNLDVTYFDGSSAGYVTASQFMATPARFFGLMSAKPKQRDYVYAARPKPDLQWMSVKDQFFTTVLMPKDVQGSGLFVNGVPLQNGDDLETTVAGDMEFNLGVLAPKAERKLELNFYVGPKEYMRLDQLGNNQDLIMQFGWFGAFSKLLLLALIGLHALIDPISPTWAWGWSIVVFTVIVQLLTWPLTAASIRSGRRMQQFQAPIKALREKYKDNPQKLQTEMMELYKKHKINPFASCLPMLVIFPIFLAFISVMRTSAQMRFQPFFWIHDLSMPDTVGHIGGFAINLLPILMAATSMIQMHVIPQPSADAKMQRMMKYMPLLYMGVFYTMPAGMIMYYTCRNVLTILQQYLTNRRKDVLIEEPPAPKSKRR